MVSPGPLITARVALRWCFASLAHTCGSLRRRLAASFAADTAYGAIDVASIAWAVATLRWQGLMDGMGV